MTARTTVKKEEKIVWKKRESKKGNQWIGIIGGNSYPNYGVITKLPNGKYEAAVIKKDYGITHKHKVVETLIDAKKYISKNRT